MKACPSRFPALFQHCALFCTMYIMDDFLSSKIVYEFVDNEDYLVKSIN